MDTEFPAKHPPRKTENKTRPNYSITEDKSFGRTVNKMTGYIPNQNSLYFAWLKNFANQCDLNAPALQLSAAELTEINSAASSFDNNYNAMVSAKAAAKQATEDKALGRQATVATVRKFARVFKAISGISQGVLQALGILTNNVSTPVVPVTGLTVTGCSDGVNQLRSNRANNINGTGFVVEYQVSGQNDWAFAGVTTRVRFDHINQTPGVEVAYRIISSRAGINSVPCPPVIVYSDGVLSEDLELAA